MPLGLELIHSPIQYTFVEEGGKEERREEEKEGRGREKGKEACHWDLI